jgi:anti-sigma factor RsiW
MSAHLSQRGISAWIAGEREGGAIAHMSGCPSCRARVEMFERTLADFRVAVRETGEASFLAAPVPVPVERAGMRLRPLWSTLAVAGMAVAAFLLAGAPESPRSAPLVANSTADAALMRQVDADVSQVVPDSMEPLLLLFAEDKASGQGIRILD